MLLPPADTRRRQYAYRPEQRGVGRAHIRFQSEGHRVAIAELSTEEAEAGYVVSTIARLHADGGPYNECAVLCRSVKTAGPMLANTLAKYEIPRRIGERQAIANILLERYNNCIDATEIAGHRSSIASGS